MKILSSFLLSPRLTVTQISLVTDLQTGTICLNGCEQGDFQRNTAYMLVCSSHKAIMWPHKSAWVIWIMIYYYDLWCFFVAILELNSLSSHSISVGEKEQCEQFLNKMMVHYFIIFGWTIPLKCRKRRTHTFHKVCFEANFHRYDVKKLPATIKVKSKPFFTDLRWTWFGKVANPTYSLSWS